MDIAKTNNKRMRIGKNDANWQKQKILKPINDYNDYNYKLIMSITVEFSIIDKINVFLCKYLYLYNKYNWNYTFKTN